jgi:DNA-binding transcriptional ArsR family regulator
MNSADLRTTLRMTKALADRQRLRILMLLQGGELCVCRLVAVLGLAPSTVSKHLSLLRAAGLVDSRKAGRWMYYRLPRGAAGKAARPALQWIARALRGEAAIVRDAKTLRRVLAWPAEIICRRQRK